jgi:hypothetical protein
VAGAPSKDPKVSLPSILERAQDCHRQLAKLDYDPTGTLRELQLILFSPHTELLKATVRAQPIPFPTRVLLSVDGTVATPHRATPSAEVHGMKGGAGMAPLRDGQWSASRSCRLNLLNRRVGRPHSTSGFFGEDDNR